RASVGAGNQSPKPAGVHEGASISAGSYRSPGKLHKAIIQSQDLESLAQAKAAGAIEIADYGSFKLFALDEGALAVAEEGTVRAAMSRDDRPLTSASIPAT